MTSTPSKLIMGLRNISNIRNGMCVLKSFRIFLFKTVTLQISVLSCVKSCRILIIATTTTETTLALIFQFDFIQLICIALPTFIRAMADVTQVSYVDPGLLVSRNIVNVIVYGIIHVLLFIYFYCLMCTCISECVNKICKKYIRFVCCK